MERKDMKSLKKMLLILAGLAFFGSTVAMTACPAPADDDDDSSAGDDDDSAS